MKIQIDTDNKIIRVIGKVLLKDLIITLDSLFPNKAWEDYRIDTDTVALWYDVYYPKPYEPHYPWLYEGGVYCVNIGRA